jgi:hypothetical protein
MLAHECDRDIIRGAFRNKLQYAFFSAGGGWRGCVSNKKIMRKPFGMTFTFSARPGNSCVDSYSVCSRHTYTYPLPFAS